MIIESDSFNGVHPVSPFNQNNRSQERKVKPTCQIWGEFLKKCFVFANVTLDELHSLVHEMV